MSGVIDTPLFDKVRAVIDDAHLIAWDGCHKIYLALDEVEADWFRAEYPHIVDAIDGPETLLATLGEWWEESCALRFIYGVVHNEENPNAGFTTLIGQFDDQDEDEAACERCGNFYDESKGDGWCGLCPSCADKDEEDDDE